MTSKQVQKRYLIVGTHEFRNQPSMTLFASWTLSALAPSEKVVAPSFFLNRWTQRLPIAKWLFYLDQYVILPVLLAVKAKNFDQLIIADHSNAPSACLVERRKIGVMVHDTIGIRQAKGCIAGAPRTSLPGRALQHLILRSLRRAARLAVNSRIVQDELVLLGVSTQCTVVGCPFDAERFKTTIGSPRSRWKTPFCLHVGTDSWRKRKDELIRE